MVLSELQRSLAASLAGAPGVVAPAGFDALQLAHTRRALEAKRRAAAAHLLPRVRRALGTAWRERFHAHATRYLPDGLLFHVDDAWAFAETLSRDGPQQVRDAAHDDLLALRLRYVRTRAAGPARIGPRRGLLISATRLSPRAVVVRLPGARGLVFTL